MGAIQILQLRQVRYGETEQETSPVFSEEQVECMEDLLPKFEGKTEKQKNSWPKKNLAWASWMIGRLGGWKGYASQRPPGVITHMRILSEQSSTNDNKESPKTWT